MEKKSLLSYLESIKDTGADTDMFVKAIYEARPDIMELERNTPKGGMYDISDKEDPSKAIDDFGDDAKATEAKPQSKPAPAPKPEQKSEPMVEQPKTESQPKEPPPEETKEKEDKAPVSSAALTIKSDIGYKRVADNAAFKNMTEETHQPISDIFSMDEVNMINESDPSDWKEADRRLIMCKKADYDDPTRKIINCYNSSNPTGLGRPNKFPREYINTFYDAVQSGKLKDANDVYTIFHSKDVYLRSPVHVLQLREKKGRNRYAIKFNVVGDESPYLMIGSELHTKFLYKIQ